MLRYPEFKVATSTTKAKAVEREPRLEGGRRSVGQDELVLLLRPAQVLGVQPAAAIERLRMADHDVLTRRACGAQAENSGGIGAKVDDVAVVTGGVHRQGGQHLHHLDAVVPPGDQSTPRRCPQRHRIPTGVIETHAAPTPASARSRRMRPGPAPWRSR
jgi:hypothetical protein